MIVSAPEPLSDHHDLDAFASGEDSLDQWLRRRALKNQIAGASRTFVVCEDRRVVAFYALASSAIMADAARPVSAQHAGPNPCGGPWQAGD